MLLALACRPAFIPLSCWLFSYDLPGNRQFVRNGGQGYLRKGRNHVHDLKNLGEQLESLISSKTVIGNPISVGEVTLVPIMKASFGFGLGGGDESVKRRTVTGGGGGANIEPIAIITVCGDKVDLLVIDKQASKGLHGLVDNLPQLFEKLPFLKKKAASEQEASEENADEDLA